MARPAAAGGEAGAADSADPRAGGLAENVEAGRCLALARRILKDDDLDVLLAKLAGLSAREIATALGLSEPAVDHRYRAAVRKLQARMRVAPGRAKGGRRD